MKKEHWSIALALVVTAACLFLAARNVHFGQLQEALAQARWRWIPAMAAVGVADLAIRAVRWRLLLGRGGLGQLFGLEAIGLAVNNVLFMRLGELARSAAAARELGLPLATVLASVVVERALDVAALLSLFNLSSLARPGLVLPQVRTAALALLAAALGGLAVLAFAEHELAPGGRLERLLRPWPKLHAFIERLALGAQALRSPGSAGAILGLSLLLWMCDALVYWAAAAAMGIAPLVGYPDSILILSWAGAGSALPAAPGAIGTFEALVKQILEKLGAAPPQAFAYAVFTHMVMYLWITALGLAFLYKVGMSLGGLREALSRE